MNERTGSDILAAVAAGRAQGGGPRGTRKAPITIDRTAPHHPRLVRTYKVAGKDHHLAHAEIHTPSLGLYSESMALAERHWYSTRSLVAWAVTEKKGCMAFWIGCGLVWLPWFMTLLFG